MKRKLHLLILALFLLPGAAICQNASVSFDGNDYVEVPEISSVLGSAARTVEAWIKAPYETNSEQVLVQWGVDDAGTKWTIRLNAGSVLRVEHGAGATFGTTALNDDQWHHVVVALAADAGLSEAKLYVDGVEETYGQQAGAACNTGSHVIYIGKANTKVSDGDKPIPVRHWIGQIDELRIWSSARTEAEIVAYKDSSICPEDHPDLAAYFTFNDGSGLDAIDKTGTFDGLFGGNVDSTNLHPTWVDSGAPVSECDCEDVGVMNKVQKSWSIYPNPVSDQFEFSSAFAVGEIYIYDITGKQVLNIRDNTSERISVRSLESGVYMVKFIGLNQEIATSRFIKQ